MPPLQPSCAFAPNQRLRPSRRWRVWLFGILLGLLVFLPGDPALALSAGSFPELPPTDHVIDQAGILSRAASGEVSHQLEVFSAERIEARLVTVNQLDYGLSLAELGQQLLERWPEDGDRAGQVIFLIDSQTNAAAVVASPALAGQLNPDLLRSTARTTMAQPIREGARFRQASLDGINRILAVLQGGDDPGEPVLLQVESQPTNIPTRDETASSNAFTWVVVLLVVGTVVPMATWWVFSR